MEPLLSAAVRNGWRRGVLRGNQVWLVVGAAAWMMRRVRRGREPHPVFVEELEPGQAVTITHFAPPGD